jgi:Caspase domain/Domain of unknown function (DUF4384)/Bacterial SH3 domain
MKHIHLKRALAVIAAITVASLASYSLAQSAGQSSTLTRATELRADKVVSSSVVSQLPIGAAVQVVSLEGGWAQVQSGGKSGWVRAGALTLSAGSSAASNMSAGREARGNTALTLGVRSLGSRSNRHALIIGISRYADPNTPALPGALVDRESARQMAEAMQVPAANITYLQNEQATGDGIRSAIKALGDRVQEGDRVFIHYSGHGTRYKDEAAGGCVEALLAHDGNEWKGMISNKEMATLLTPMTNKTDKLFVMYDACHSGGVISNAATTRTRGFLNNNDEGRLRPKFAAISEECGKPVNMKTRNLLVEAVAQKALPQDIVHLSSSRDNEVSFDDEQKGGLATQFMRDCMLRDAKDLDKSGAISINEIKQCAQEKINDRMKGDALFKAHNLALSGNADFVPAWFSQPAIAATVPVPSQASTQPAVPTQTPTTALPLTGEQALQRLFEQRDGKRKVTVSAAKTELKIGQDALDFSVKSDKAGYVYVALAASDNKSLYVLFPNSLDANNKIDAGQTLALPRPNWKVRAAGPEGTDQLLVIVSDGPRDLGKLAKNKAGPFVASLNDADGRADLGIFLTNSAVADSAQCTAAGARAKNPECSDAFGAAMLRVTEVK